MFGPVITREALTSARRPRLYLARVACAAALLVLICTAWQVVTGTRVVRNTGDLARFNALVFQVLAPLELVVCMFLSAISVALTVTQEKDRRTLALLLLTRLANVEMVLGQLAAGLLGIASLGLAAGGVFFWTYLLGGVSLAQILGTLLVLASTALLCGSLGCTIALWREKTFQTMAGTVLVLVCWTGGWELFASGGWPLAISPESAAAWASRFSPWHAVLQAAANPAAGIGRQQLEFPLVALLLAILLNGLSTWKIRAWSGASETHAPLEPRIDAPPASEDEQHALDRFGRQDTAPVKAGRVRSVWARPILWREIRTWAYGRKVLAVRAAFAALAIAAIVALGDLETTAGALSRLDAAAWLVPLFVLGLLLVNAQAVTSITNERDGQTLDLLLVTDITPGEFIGGKLAGVLYNTKEMVLLPIALCGYLWWLGELSGENLAYLLGGWLAVLAFAAVLGLHAGMSYGNSRVAIGVSLGTLFFLVIGVATCMRIMVAFSGSFSFQLQPFLAAMVGGFVGLYLALGARNPSPAITAAALICPLATLYALTSFLLGYTLAVFLVTTAAYGFAAAAMLVPAIYEFDVVERRRGRDES
ncbi:MAG TPA: hypothetical protein VHV55_01820 [Pirellulales bacterium]|nr:hypothetical protein [Pirellulales bacterium]